MALAWEPNIESGLKLIFMKVKVDVITRSVYRGC